MISCLMWDWILARVDIAKHGSELSLADAKPIHSSPYRTGPKTREFQKNKMHKVLSEGIMKAEQRDWAGLTVFMLKKKGPLRFFINFRKLDAGTMREVYGVLRMDKCIFIAEESDCFTLDGNSKSLLLGSENEVRDQVALTLHHLFSIFADAIWITEGSG